MQTQTNQNIEATMKTKHLSPSRLILTISTAALYAFTFHPTISLASPPQYTITDLGTLGGSFSYGVSVNASGQVAAYSLTTNNNTNHAARGTNGSLTDLGTLNPSDPGTLSKGLGINASGQVAGFSYLAGISIQHAVRWTGITAEDLGTLGGSQSKGYGINASGQVAGFSLLTGDVTQHATVWTGTTATDLGAPVGGGSGAFGINDFGQVAGFSGGQAVRWTGTTPTILGTLPTGNGSGTGYGINAAGQVVGTSSYRWTEGDNNFHQHAVIWNGTTPTEIDSGRGSDSTAYAINSLGDVIGVIGASSFLYTGGTMYDLFSLLVPGSGATAVGFGDADGFVGSAINDFGQIAGTASYGGVAHAVLLTPTPEPASALLLLGGAATFLARRRRNAAEV